jgi:hypothetical protein
MPAVEQQRTLLRCRAPARVRQPAPPARSPASSAGPVEKQRREGATRSYRRPSATPAAASSSPNRRRRHARIRWLTIPRRARRRRPGHCPVPQPAAHGGTHPLRASDRSACPAGKSAYPALRTGQLHGREGANERSEPCVPAAPAVAPGPPAPFARPPARRRDGGRRRRAANPLLCRGRAASVNCRPAWPPGRRWSSLAEVLHG